MNLSHFCSAALAVIKAKTLKIKVPLAVSWALTFRCNQKCLYCGIWKGQCPELKTSEILEMIGQFRELGTRWISFTGGEPFLRDDLAEILKYTKRKGMYVRISSNGKLVPQKKGLLQYIDGIKLSLDGPVSINDSIRGEGSFAGVMEAIKVCQRSHIPVYLECTMSKFNIDSLDWVINFAKDLGLKVMFQPAAKKTLWSDQANPISAPVDKYRVAVSKLIRWKQRGAPIFNSLTGLNHLYFWPECRKISCTAGSLSFDVEPDGTILNCDRAEETSLGKNKISLDIKKAIKEMKPVRSCTQCWCSSLIEFNLISSLNPDAIFNYFKMSRFTKTNSR
jgi:MoaA/NifB/PqqE/SkfB family radical SAM enzyme